MAKYTKQEFAEQCGMTTRSLASYTNQGYVVIGDDGLIDTDNAVNFRLLTKRQNKRRDKPNTNDSPQYIPKSTDGEDDGIPSYEESERRVKYFDSLKREKEVQRIQIEIDKKRGEVIPSELVIPLFLQHNKSIITSFNNVCNAILTEYAKKKDFTPDEISEMRGRMIGAINEGIRDAQNLTKAVVKNIVSEYSEKRGIGERIG